MLDICPHCSAPVLFTGSACPACGKQSQRHERAPASDSDSRDVSFETSQDRARTTDGTAGRRRAPASQKSLSAQTIRDCPHCGGQTVFADDICTKCRMSRWQPPGSDPVNLDASVVSPEVPEVCSVPGPVPLSQNATFGDTPTARTQLTEQYSTDLSAASSEAACPYARTLVLLFLGLIVSMVTSLFSSREGFTASATVAGAASVVFGLCFLALLSVAWGRLYVTLLIASVLFAAVSLHSWTLQWTLGAAVSGCVALSCGAFLVWVLCERHMRAYGVYVNAAHDFVAVKEGFSWPGFFFTFLWAFFAGLPGRGFLLLAYGLFLRVAELIAQGTRHSGAYAIVIFLYLSIALYVGVFGNEWVAKRLVKQGYQRIRGAKATNKDDAVRSE